MKNAQGLEESVSGRTVTRRATLRLGGAALAAGLLARPGYATAQDGTPPAAPAVSGPTFVGIADDGLTYVAVIVEPAASDGAERQVRAYLCDPPQIDVWFKGASATTDAELTADDGGTLTLELGRTEVTGTAVLADGTELAFALEPARGGAGFYAVRISSEGVVTADSADGEAYLEGWVLGDALIPQDGGDGVFPVAAAIVPSDGAPLAILGRVTARGESDDCRLIVLADGTSKGAGKTKPTASDPGQGFTWEIWL